MARSRAGLRVTVVGTRKNPQTLSGESKVWQVPRKHRLRRMKCHPVPHASKAVGTAKTETHPWPS